MAAPLEETYLTGPDGNCPDLIADYQALADMICQKFGDARVYVDGQDRSLSDRITSLEGDTGLSDRINSLQNLINSLDADGNNVLDGLEGYQAELDLLKGRVTAVESQATNNAIAIAADGQRLTDYIGTNNAAVSNLQSDVTALNTTTANALDAANSANTKSSANEVTIAQTNASVAQHTSDIAGLQSAMSDLPNSEFIEEKMREAECTARKVFSDALQGVVDRLNTCAAFPEAPAANEPPQGGDGEVL